ncbi:MAG: SEC-C metal-binding domain-containing protein, partial [Kiritimatiellia bacterium]|nr:SEC-C metal-binding domain-containing protein [Kiritimatiellia bacterium]
IMIAYFIRAMRYLPPWEVNDEDEEEEEEEEEEEKGEPISTPKSQTPRNAPCPCGSGKKYKRCCGSAD